MQRWDQGNTSELQKLHSGTLLATCRHPNAVSSLLSVDVSWKGHGRRQNIGACSAHTCDRDQWGGQNRTTHHPREIAKHQEQNQSAPTSHHCCENKSNCHSHATCPYGDWKCKAPLPERTQSRRFLVHSFLPYDTDQWVPHGHTPQPRQCKHWNHRRPTEFVHLERHRKISYTWWTSSSMAHEVGK